MDFKDKVKLNREKLGYTLEELAKLVGVSAPTIQRYESGEIKNVRRDKISKLAKALNVSPAYLMGWNEEAEDKVTIIGKADIMKTYKYIPSSVAAGSPENIDGQNYQQISIPSSFLGKYANHSNLIIMKVNGDSMNKIIPDGSLIGILPYETSYDIQDGDIVVFNDESYNYSVKRYYKVDSKIIFKPESTSPIFTDIIYDLAEETVEIIGKVVMYNVIL